MGRSRPVRLRVLCTDRRHLGLWVGVRSRLELSLRSSQDVYDECAAVHDEKVKEARTKRTERAAKAEACPALEPHCC